MAEKISKLEYVFLVEEIKKLLENNSGAKELTIRLEMGVQEIPSKTKKGAPQKVITTSIKALVKKTSKSKKTLKSGEGDDSVNGYPDPPGNNATGS